MTRPKLPVIAAPRSRNTANSAQNVAGQTASEALVEVSKIVAAQEIDGKPRVHSLVPPEKDLPFDAAVRFEKMPLVQILELYGEFTGRRLLKGAGLNEQLTVDIVVNQESELMISEVVQAFDIVLNQNQVAIVPVGDKFLLALGAAQAIKEGLPFSDLDRNRMPEAPTLLTKIVQLQYAETKDVVNVIQKFAKVAGGITIVESTKTLIIQDYAINMKRMLELIERIDVAAPPTSRSSRSFRCSTPPSVRSPTCLATSPPKVPVSVPQGRPDRDELPRAVAGAAILRSIARAIGTPPPTAGSGTPPSGRNRQPRPVRCRLRARPLPSFSNVCAISYAGAER